MKSRETNYSPESTSKYYCRMSTPSNQIYDVNFQVGKQLLGWGQSQDGNLDGAVFTQ